MPRASKFGSESVRVVVRCRPLNDKELANSHQRIVKIDLKRGAVLLTNPKLQDEAPREFMFDAAYDSDSKQVDLYDESFRPLVDSVLEGFNGTIFAYGQTGTGKTFTMEGVRKDPELWGVIPRSFEHIFSHISASSNCQFLVRASYMEIYQEEIRDLLHKDQSRRLELKERPDTGTYVKDLSSFVCKSVKEISHIMSTGNANRSVGATDMNEHSSRSHAIFLVTVERGELSADDGEMHFRMGKLNLVDLAGSERQAKTGAVGERFKEATKINLSLSALGNVISALVDGKSSHIPYRDSKLTRLLQASLGGNARTIMVSNFGPASYNYEETLGTLRYASRAKNIKNKPKINEDPKDALLRQFQEEIAQLQAQLSSRGSGGSARRRRKKGGARVDKEGSTAAAVSDAEDGSVVSAGDEDATPEQSLEQQRQRLQQEHADILSNNNLIAEDRDRLLADMRQKQEQLDEERRAQQRLAARIASMQSKLLSGDDGNGIADRTDQQQQQLQQHKQRLVEQKIREREVLQQLEREEETRLDVQQTYTSLQQEVDVKSRKLKKLYRRLETAKRELHDAEDEFNQERRELQAVQQTLYRELKLKTLILENFVPSEERVKLLNRSVYDDDEDMWKLSASASTLTSSSAGVQLERPRRPISTPGSRRPVSELAAKRSALRYKYENLIALELDSPGRTTRQYTAPSVAPRVQAALQAALTPHEREINIDALSSLHVSNFLMKAATKPTSANSVGGADCGRSPSVLQLSSPPPEMAPSRTGHRPHPTNPSSPSEPQLYPRARGLVPK